jgi:aminopeptidase YwaD
MYTPDFNPSYLNGVMESILDFMNRFNDERYPPQKDFQIISIGGSRDRLQGRMVPYMTGTDHEVFNNAGIPGTGPLAWPDFFYHSSEDTPAKVDPTELHRVVFAGLAAALTMGYADDQNAQDLARVTLLYGQKRIALSESEAVAALLSSSKEGFTENDFLAMNLIRHVYHREREAVRSSGTFSRKAETGKSIERLALMLDDDEKVSRKNVEEIASLRAKELGVERTVVQLSEEERRASRMIPAREKGMELYNINYAVRKAGKDAPVKEVQAMIVQALGRLQEKGISALRLMSMPDAASHYADGKRSILDIRNAVAADYGLLPVDALILYFKVFEQAGLMKIVEKGS